MSYTSGGGLTREQYVTIICRGYLVIGRPIPEEFWDEWEAICAKEALPKSIEDRLLEIPPDPLEVWAVMHDSSEFLLYPSGPSKDSMITLAATVPTTGLFWYFQLRRPDGTILAQFDGSMVNRPLVAGDSLHCTLDAEQMVKFLVP